MDLHSGGCLRGGVRYQARGPLREVIFCHCSQCRRQTGLYYAATSVAQADLTLLVDQPLRWFAASEFAERGFCGTCGSALFWRPRKAGHIAILAGSLDDPSALKAGYHICCEGRPAYYPVEGALPQYPHSAPGVAIDGV